MAYQTRGRDPLLDSTMQAAIEKRGKELVGLGLIALGVMAALMIASYSPDDPSWLMATDAPVQNRMGRLGASIAHPLYMIMGLGSWLIPLILCAGGIRLAAHWGEERVLSRIVIGPVAVAVAAIFCATLVPPPAWPHSFGIGGLFGDTVLGMILTILPIGPGLAVNLLSLGLGLVTVVLSLFVLGFTGDELRALRRWLLVGLVLSYDVLVRMLGRALQGVLTGARGAGSRVHAGLAARAERRAMQAAAAPAFAPAFAQAEIAVPGRTMAETTGTQRATAILRAPIARGDDRSVAEGAALMPPAAHDPARPVPDMPGGRVMPPLTGGHRSAAERKMPPMIAPSMAGPDTPVAPPHAIPRTPPPVMAPTDRPHRARVEPAPAASGGFLASILRRKSSERGAVPAEVLSDGGPNDLDPAFDPEAGLDENRIRSRIAEAIRSRKRTAEPEPPPARPRGPRPLILDPTRHRPQPLGGVAAAAVMPPMPAGRIEPPLTARPAASTAYAPLPAEDDTFADMPHIEPFEDEVVWDEEMPPRLPPEATLPVAEPRRAVLHPPKRAPAPSTRARAEAQPSLPLEDRYADYEFPPLSLLTSPDEVERHHLPNEALEENARMLESVLDDYGVKGEIVSVRPGPVVTMYELEPAPGLKASRVIGLADDIARSMSALSARVSTVPGRSVIGIELPNAKREKVVLREILSARDFGDSQMRLPLALGKDIAGEPIVANLAKMPHLLIAGTTGSGKSVAINTMILSLLYKLTPEECRLIMIDPKMLELSVYDGIPHLLSPVVTDPKKAVVALKWTVGEMEERYRKMSKMGVRNIEGYNGRVREALAKGEMFSRTVQTGFDDETGDPIFETDEFQPEVLPYIVVIVDEMADLMMVAGKEIEACIQRLAQMARASGIHLIMATQRPSVDVITGTIKANFPTRISFQVTSKIDSRTILGEMGAEQLLGMGDMLYMAGGGRITRIHGPFCSDEEVEEIVNHLKGFGPPDYMSGVVEGPDEDTSSSIDAVLGLGTGSETEDALYDMAVQIVAKDRKCSTSYIQRKLGIGYNKAARLVEQMEEEGVVTPANHVGKREILVPEPH
ncbi:MAG: DNA translocase FtsK 4TM domain-containing protein [Rubellimicrobium sp.]|nr:DNA translocase FtsK 4TM domain-containing protein [Rubellimicrobium sp.]